MKNFESIQNSNVSIILSQSKLFFPKNAMEKLKFKKKKNIQIQIDQNMNHSLS